MIGLLGTGAVDAGEAPLLRRVCLRLERTGELIAVLTSRRAEGRALLDVVSGHRVPDEGRSWVDGIPLMRQTAPRVQAIMADASPGAWLAERRSLLWNTLRTPRTVLGGLLRIPRPAERAAAIEALTAVRLEHRARDVVGALSPSERARAVLARALARRPRAVVMRDVTATLGVEEAAGLLGLARTQARAERLLVLASMESVDVARAAADRLLVITDGLLVFHGPAVAFTDELA